MSGTTNFDSTKDADVVVIGGGPGGYPAAIRAAQLGARVVCIEADTLGGTCLNWGCIPTKTMIGSVAALHTIKHAADFGLTAENVGFDFGKIMARKDKIVSTLTGGVGYLLGKKHKVKVIDGFGKILDKNTVEVTKADGSVERVTTSNIVVATGSVPTKLPIPGIDSADVWVANKDLKAKKADGSLAAGMIWTSNEAVSAKTVPGELVVIGGGVIGCEFAYTYNGLGSKVTVLEFLPRIIATMDEDLSAELGKILKKQGVDIKLNVKVVRVEDEAGRKKVVFADQSGAESSVMADAVLVATGRSPYTENLGLDTVGVTIGSPKGKRAIAVDAQMRTNVAGIYAIGDVIGSGLAHTATAEGLVAAETICGHTASMSYKAIPSCIYTEPEVAAVGLTEAQAREQGYDVAVGTMPFRTLGKAMAINERDGFVKIVADKKYGEILGVHIIGPHATDLVMEGVVSIQLENTVEELMKTVHAHPSLSEAMGQANEDVRGLAIDKG